MKTLKNLNFIPREIKEKQLAYKVKIYEKYVLILWVICLIAFASFLYNKNRDKKIVEVYNISHEEKNDINPEKVFKSRAVLDNLQNFMHDFSNNLNYNTIVVKDNVIDLDLSVHDKKEYFNFIERIEKLNAYKIIFLSSLYEEKEKLNFKISLEVKS